MTTLVGIQTEFSSAVKDLLELEYDAVEAYDAAINRIKNQQYKDKLQEFKSDHLNHITKLTNLLRDHAHEAPTGPSLAKQWLTKGKVVLANLISDEAIIAAMVTNEVDTNTAYERMNKREDIWEDSKSLLQDFLGDERRHKAWLQSLIAG